MADKTLCNDCGSEVKYINTRKEGILKCVSEPIKAVQESGRILEVYLIHECNNESLDKTSLGEVKERKLWVGPDSHS